MNNDDEAAVVILVGMKRSVGTSVINNNGSYTVPVKHGFWLSPELKGPRRQRKSLKSSRGVAKPRPSRKKALSKVQGTRSKVMKPPSKHAHVGLVHSPVSVTSTNPHHTSLLPTVSHDNLSGVYNNPNGRSNIFGNSEQKGGPNTSSHFPQWSPPFLPQLGSSDDANDLPGVVRTLVQQQSMALTKHVSSRDLASSLLAAEIENLQIVFASQQHAQNNYFSSSLRHLFPNNNVYDSVPITMNAEGMDINSVASALITSWLLQTCSKTVS